MSPKDRKPEDSQEQQQLGGQSSGRQQEQSGTGNQYGEGNYKATRQYNEGMKEHVENHDIEKEARDAAPRSDAEAREMEDAERAGRSRAKGNPSPDDPENQDDVTQ